MLDVEMKLSGGYPPGRSHFTFLVPYSFSASTSYPCPASCSTSSPPLPYPMSALLTPSSHREVISFLLYSLGFESRSCSRHWSSPPCLVPCLLRTALFFMFGLLTHRMAGESGRKSWRYPGFMSWALFEYYRHVKFAISGKPIMSHIFI